MIKQSQRVLHNDWLLQQGGRPLVTGNISKGKKPKGCRRSQMHRQILHHVSRKTLLFFIGFSCGWCTVYCQTVQQQTITDHV